MLPDELEHPLVQADLARCHDDRKEEDNASMVVSCYVENPRCSGVKEVSGSWSDPEGPIHPEPLAGPNHLLHDSPVDQDDGVLGRTLAIGPCI